MSKRRPQFDGQLGLPLASAGSAADALDLANAAWSIAIRRCPWSRGQLAEKLSDGLGRTISEAQLNAWLAQSNGNRIPLDVSVELCGLLNDWHPLDYLLAAHGRSVAAAGDRAYAELGRCVHDEEKLAERKANAWRAVKGGGR